MQFNKLIPIISPAFLLASIIGLVEAMGWILRGVSHSPNKAILYLLYASLGYGFLTIIFLLIFLSLSNKTTKHDTSLVANSFCIPIGMFIFALFISFLEGGRVQLFVFAPASLALSISVCLLFRKYIFSRFINLFSLQLMLIFHLVALSLSFLLICILFEVGIWALIGFLVFFLAVIFAITSIFSKRLRNNKLLFSLSNMVILVCLIFMLLGHSSSANFNLPRIILITIDTLRPDHLGSYGNKDVNTRNIDKLAAEGTQFNNALSPSPRTGPSHISILTGLYPKHHGAIDNGDWIADEVIALPEILSAQGYSTAAFVSGWTLKNQACGLRSRFHFYEENFSSWRFLPESIVKIRLYMAFLTIVGQFVSHPFEPERPAAKTTDAAIKWIKSHRNVPFFLWVHYYDPHVPYEPPKRFRDGADHYKNTELNPNWWRLDRENREALVSDSILQQKMVAYYNGEISYVDEQIGRLEKTWDELGLSENLIQIVTSDHGESLGEHNYYYAHDDLYDVCLRVPLIMKRNGENTWPAEIDDPVRLIDLTPTLLEMLGIDTGNLSFDGKSVLSNLENREKFDTEKLFATLVEKTEMYSLRFKGHKLIWTSPTWHQEQRIPEKEELYDLSVDPGEMKNIIDSNPAVLSQLRKLLYKFKQEKVDVPSKLSNEVKKKLRSLGYIK